MSEESPVVTSEEGISEEGRTRLNGVDWRENVKSVAPDYVAEWDEFKNADSPEKFFDQLKNHRSMIGQSIRIPTGEAGAEQMNEFYNKIQTKVPGLMRTPNPDDADQVRNTFSKLGMPDSADGYDDFENSGIDAETMGTYRALAHEAGLTKSQFKKFIANLSERTKTSIESAESARAEDVAGLRGEWGAAFEQRAGICAKVAQRTGAPQALCDAVAKGEADAKTMKWLYSLSTQLGGERMNFIQDDPNVPTPAEVEGQIADIMSNRQHPYWLANHPAHKQAVDKMLALRRQLMSA